LDFGLKTANGVTVRELAEGAVLVEYPEDTEERANRRAVAAALSLLHRAPPLVFDAVPGARTLLLLFNPRKSSPGRIAEEVRRGSREEPDPLARRRTVEIPVFYDSGGETGPDLENIARSAGLTAAEFARRHAAGEYRVAFLGFARGFPYLTGLAAELHAPRLATPRTRVPAGSVGIGDRYTGIYPGETPGGWRLIGRAPVRLFDPNDDPPSILLPGDGVRFQQIGREEFEKRRPILDRGARACALSGSPLLSIIVPGVLTSVQGGPRRGRAIYGVPPGGAMDFETLSRGNALVGNLSDAAALEMTLVGPEVEFLAEAWIALCGGSTEARINGRPLEAGSVHAVWPGDSLTVGPIRGSARAYLCAAGGLGQTNRPELSRRLDAGDVVFLDARTRVTPRAPAGSGRPDSDGTPAAQIDSIRVLPGPQRDRFEPYGLTTFLGTAWRVSASSDRRGIRLEGPAVGNIGSSEIPPEGTVLGAIQVPGDGQPIILGPDRPVTGGYAKIATVLESDFSRVARALPGAVLRFREAE
jgi:KipI family sensor histidine kinase inhibitor